MNYSKKHIQILETAENLFAIKGFEGSTVRDIAEKAGVNIAMISYYFGSKEKLMEALFEQKTGHIKMRVESLLKNDSLTPIQKVNLLIEEHIEKVMDHQKFFKIMLCEQVINKNPAILDLLAKVKKRNTEIIGELIKDGQKKGYFKKKVDVVLLLSTMIGTATQMMINKPYYRDFNNMQKMPAHEFDEMIRNKLSDHVKKIFKAILTDEA